MNIEIKDFFESIGTVFENKKDLMDVNNEFVVLPAGLYLIVSADETGYNLYDIKKQKNVTFEPDFLTEEDYNIKFNIFDAPIEEILDWGIESYIKKIMQLSAEGWEINTNNKYFDLTPYVKQLENFQYLKNVINGASQDEVVI